MKLTMMICLVGFLVMEWAQAKPADAVDLTKALPAEEPAHDAKQALGKELDGR